MATSWNYAEIWRRIGATQPHEAALIQGERMVSWGEFTSAAESFASYFRSRGVSDQATVALYLYNSPEYLMSFAGTLFGRYVPVNTNYRYGVEELEYLFDNSDAEALVFHGSFTARVDEIRARLPKLRQLVWVDDATTPCPEWAVPFDTVIAAPVLDQPAPSGDDLIFLYTGGTTGMPKGVMWRQDDLVAKLNAAQVAPLADGATNEDLVSAVLALGPGGASIPACPLMHGTGLFSAMTTLTTGGRVVLLTNRHYDPAELAETIERHAVHVLVIVGDPFARPLVRLLDSNPGRYDISSLVSIVSSGAMWSEEIKKGLLAHHPNMLLVDAFSSSEALGMGSSISSGQSAERTARFSLGPDVIVATDEGVRVTPGSDEVGKLMLGGRNPLGYYKDEAKTAATFRVIDGQRYSVPGDMAKVNADGSIQLLGRGSQCINTAGEKVFPEEVEETLKLHDAVADACVVGVADEEYGQRVLAAVELHPGSTVDEDALIHHVKSHLASYKAPAGIRFVDSIGRAANGKMEYARHQAEAAEWWARRSG